MGMASLFADIDGFTKYVDSAILGGEVTIRNAVRDIHVLREELNSVLNEDFGGKRVRFIGDCIQGVVTMGTRYSDDGARSVKDSLMCASGMRSSFSLAQRILKTIDKLDLAIGIEYGPVSLTRVGQRGEESVRCAAGIATRQSERLQQSIVGGGIILGENALAQGDDAVRKHFQAPTKLPSYSDLATHFGAIASPAVQIMRDDASARPHATQTAV
jgi:class 3 adenylate cyclase